ncbi:MAG: phosphate signaling complex protein PhoU [Chitinispirillaceae bacterium]
MTLIMQKETDKLKKALLSLCALVVNNVSKSVRAVMQKDSEAAYKVMANDREIDSAEIEVEEECLKILALHQPVAGDLRFIIAVMKINNDLERVGDLAVNIAENAIALAKLGNAPSPFDLSGMSEIVIDMLNKSIDALINIDTELAHAVCQMDDSVDKINREMYSSVKNCIVSDPEKIDCLIHYLSISRHLERIGDHATNISEDIIYMNNGEIIRHKVRSNEPHS